MLPRLQFCWFEILKQDTQCKEPLVVHFYKTRHQHKALPLPLRVYVWGLTIILELLYLYTLFTFMRTPVNTTDSVEEVSLDAEKRRKWPVCCAAQCYISHVNP